MLTKEDLSKVTFQALIDIENKDNEVIAGSEAYITNHNYHQ